MDFLDYDVVEAYWLGNPILEKFEDDDMKEIIEKLMSRGLPKSIGKDLIKKCRTVLCRTIISMFSMLELEEQLGLLKPTCKTWTTAGFHGGKLSTSWE